tara:strand:- start:83 stop:1135 length:1053 start_codon:yes stop_codon:yes gene_type:complete
MAAYTTIDDPEAHFQVKLYSANNTAIGSGGLAVTLDGDTDMQPDFVWIKSRSATEEGVMTDSVRGTTKIVRPNDTYAETTAAEGLTTFGSDGFTVGNSDQFNASGGTYVAWCWKGGGSASANSVGSISSSVSANTTSGFGIATYTGSGSADTVGHGIGKVPQVVIAKRRDSTSHYMVYHHSMGNAKEIYFNLSSTESAAANTWNSTTPTTTVSSVKNDANNTSTGTFVNYLFAPVQGFSKFGKYTGNGNADGPFVYTGFRPALVIIKNISATQNWTMNDNKRLGYNPDNNILFPNTNGADHTGDNIDLLSNGFKIRWDDGVNNTDGQNFIYMAFAEAPFVNSNGVPSNAR